MKHYCPSCKEYLDEERFDVDYVYKMQHMSAWAVCLDCNERYVTIKLAELTNQHPGRVTRRMERLLSTQTRIREVRAYAAEA